MLPVVATLRDLVISIADYQQSTVAQAAIDLSDKNLIASK
jgi:hypothetical protein